jgi:hypothetical protein
MSSFGRRPAPFLARSISRQDLLREEGAALCNPSIPRGFG